MGESTRPPLTFSFFPPVPTFELTSSDIGDGLMLKPAQVASGMGYSGANRSPQLSWRGFPLETRGFAITVHDPDAPTGSGFWHWLVVNLPASLSHLDSAAGDEGGSALPAGSLQIRNDAGTLGYFGAAPPPGDEPHRYVHTVHALDVESLEVDQGTSAAVVGFNLRFHTIARAQLVPIFGS